MLVLRNNNFRSAVFIYLAIFIFLSVGIESLHCHSGPEFSDNCPACVWLSKITFIFWAFLIFILTFYAFRYTLVSIQIALVNKAYQAFQYLRSPPISI